MMMISSAFTDLLTPHDRCSSRCIPMDIHQSIFLSEYLSSGLDSHPCLIHGILLYCASRGCCPCCPRNGCQAVLPRLYSIQNLFHARPPHPRALTSMFDITVYSPHEYKGHRFSSGKCRLVVVYTWLGNDIMVCCPVLYPAT